MNNFAESTAKKAPFVRIVKRSELSSRNRLWLQSLSLALALIAGGLFILVVGQNPLQIYGTMITGSFRNQMAIQATVRFTVPLLITTLGVTLAFKMKFWNIGAEGQVIMGAIFASYFALFHSDWPHL